MGQRIPEKEIANFQFADLKQNTVPYIAVMRFGAWLLIFMRKELGQKIIAPRFWQGDDFL